MAWVDVSLFTIMTMIKDKNSLLTGPTDGFFDAGMLLHALKGLHAERERGGEKPQRRRPVGKKLSLTDY